MSDIDTVVVDSLKALDPKRPIREADMPNDRAASAYDPRADISRGNPAMQQSPAAPGVLSFGAASQARVQ